MAQSSYLSIGDVLELLQQEFDDVSISKIRFLESQGLINPARTASGYRKFSDDDVSRLRWILEQQREQFLPLKVIKQRLQNGSGKTTSSSPTTGLESATSVRSRGKKVPRSSLFNTGMTDVSLTQAELAGTSGLRRDKIEELERYGLISSSRVGGKPHYDEDALIIAKLFAEFQDIGVEPRHVKIYKNAAEREASLVEQLVAPLLKQHNPQSRKDALKTIERINELGSSLRTALLRKALRHLVKG